MGLNVIVAYIRRPSTIVWRVAGTGKHFFTQPKGGWGCAQRAPRGNGECTHTSTPIHAKHHPIKSPPRSPTT